MELVFTLVMGVLPETFQPIYYVFNRHSILISCQYICYIIYLWTTWTIQISSLSLFPLTCFLITELTPLQGCSCSKGASRGNFGWGDLPLLLSFQWAVVLQVSSSLTHSCVSLPATLSARSLSSVPHGWEEEGAWSWGKGIWPPPDLLHFHHQVSWDLDQVLHTGVREAWRYCCYTCAYHL